MIAVKNKDKVVDTGELTDVFISYLNEVTLRFTWENHRAGELVITEFDLKFLKKTLQGVAI